MKWLKSNFKIKNWSINFLVVVIFFASFSSYAEDKAQIPAENIENAETLSLPPEEPVVEKNVIVSPSDQIQSGAKLSGKSMSEKSGPAKGKDNVGAVLDFEGEVIEGERRRPDLFLQMSIDNVKFDSLIYNRDDFNDYLETDKKSRNRFFKMK